MLWKPTMQLFGRTSSRTVVTELCSDCYVFSQPKWTKQKTRDLKDRAVPRNAWSSVPKFALAAKVGSDGQRCSIAQVNGRSVVGRPQPSKQSLKPICCGRSDGGEEPRPTEPSQTLRPNFRRSSRYDSPAAFRHRVVRPAIGFQARLRRIRTGRDCRYARATRVSEREK